MKDSVRGNGKIDVVLFDFGGVIAEEGFRNSLKLITPLLDGEWNIPILHSIRAAKRSVTFLRP